MQRSPAPELSNEAFDAWMKQCDRDAAIAAAADEVGGPRMSLVPVAEHDAAWPTDLLPPGSAPALATPAADTASAADRAPSLALVPADLAAGEPAATPPPADAADAATAAASPVIAEPFDGVALPDSRKRLAGWSAERQRHFLANLAETGSVHLAATAARLSARSAYGLRARSPAFAQAWDTAEQLAVGRLSALAFDRAINGRTEQVWEHGMLVIEKRLPSDRILMWLLARLDPRRFAAPAEQRTGGAADPQAAARAAFPDQLDAIADLPG